MTNDEPEQKPAEVPPPPTGLSRQFVRYLVGFGVSVAVGLAPYLGKLEIPLFTPLLNLIPWTLHNTLLPLSAAMMGLVAVLVQWYGSERLTAAWLRRSFRVLVVTAIALLLALVIVHTFVAVEVIYEGGAESATFLVGFTRPHRAPCTQEVSDAECIKLLSFDPAAIASFWGDRQIRIAQLALTLTYLGFTSCFGALVGLLLLKERQRKLQ
jgi:hypothetical protein